MYNYQVGISYNFTTLAPAVLGANYTNLKLLGMVDYSTAIKFSNIDQQAQVIYPLLPIGISADVTTYVYLLFKTALNTTIALANVWISESTVVVSSPGTITAVISNVSMTDINVISNALQQMGYTSINISIA